MATTITDELRWRGLIYDKTEEIDDLVSRQKITLYNGFDPTGNSLHIGNLVPLMQLARWQRYGHTPIALAGGGTGMVGDPSGKSAERNLMTLEAIDDNVEHIKKQLASILDFEVKSNPARVVNNADWLRRLLLTDFLRDTGKHFTVNYMLAKDSVKSRMDRDDSGISYTEFSYMLLQAHDYLHLFDTQGCLLQTGGSDQWGNIVAGVELIRRSRGQKAHALVYPLLTRADGSKFGKTAEGTSVWLSPARTSPYRFYQYWFNADDADVITYLNFFTWLTQAEIAELHALLFEQPERREAQRRLAREVTRMVHGETALAKAESASQALFGGDVAGLDAADIEDIFAEVPSSEIDATALSDGGAPLVDLLVAGGLATSKADARRKIQGGGIYLNNERVTDQAQTAQLGQAIDGRFLILRQGRRQYHLVRIRS
ncbi:Tyrosine--tRNA ligase [Candidatus Promineifilum breve]|uniref:Tyrosine--tRNA ligase n=1 Tax=Candidatus Promineifilum breve TaxID=1806508 RepID=A0A160T2U5_9CHLR|nr:tyrosine--tRNA ligase [Candidatus Promineifilum breve]CUS02895.2 Tyrosine--tRNA ligase [Candidatus Promineifilum breve]